MPEEPALAARNVRGIMPTIRGRLERVDTLSAPAPNIEVRTLLSDGTVLRVRTKIGSETLIARGIEPGDVSDLRKGEIEEMSYRSVSIVLQSDSNLGKDLFMFRKRCRL